MSSRIRVVWGTGSAPTAVASYDAALAAAGIHNYNLVTVSSIIPPATTVERVDTAPDLGLVGNKLTVVQARITSRRDRATAGLGWITSDHAGVFYEVEGTMSESVAQGEITRGLERARSLRNWEFNSEESQIISTSSDDEYSTAVVLAIYGRSEPI